MEDELQKIVQTQDGILYLYNWLPEIGHGIIPVIESEDVPKYEYNKYYTKANLVQDRWTCAMCGANLMGSDHWSGPIVLFVDITIHLLIFRRW